MSTQHKALHEFVSDTSDAVVVWDTVKDIWPDSVCLDYDYLDGWIDFQTTRTRSDWRTDGVPNYLLIPPAERKLPSQLETSAPKVSSFTIHPTMPSWSIKDVRTASHLSDLWPHVPSLRIDYFRSAYRELDPFTRLDRLSSIEPPKRSASDVPLSIDVGMIRAVWHTNDSDAARAVDRFFRRLKKFATNKIARVDRSSLEVVERVERGGWTWVCPSALEWSRAHPLNFIKRRWKPIDWELPRLE